MPLSGTTVQTISDPRSFPISVGSPDASTACWLDWAQSSLAAATGQEGAAADAHLHRGIVGSLAHGDIASIESAFGSAPSAVVYRHLLRALHAAWDDPALDRDDDLAAHGFAIPIVIVAAAESAIELPMILGDVRAIEQLLKEHACLAGNQNFAVANVLAGSGQIGVEALSRWVQWRGASRAGQSLRDVQPAPLRVAGSQEGAHLRFLVGCAYAARGVNLFGSDSPGGWGAPFAQMLSRQFGRPGLQVLAIPRAPAVPLVAAHRGQAAHREIALQLFAGNAIRTLRANFGEPTAVVSAHRVEGRGELRLSLSSVFGERDAEGFHCPLFPSDRIDDVLTMIVELLRECRLGDIRVVQGIHPDRVPSSGLPLLFRADAVGPGETVPFH